jgi:hypothetical protein
VAQTLLRLLPNITQQATIAMASQDKNISGSKLKPRVSDDASIRSCGNCGRTIRMRDDSENVLCTDILGVVGARLEDVCENYEERFIEYSEQLFQ